MTPTPTLVFCQNIFPAETLPEVEDALTGPTARVRVLDAAAGNRDAGPYPIGLRLSAAAVAGLQAPGALARFAGLLEERGYRPATVNGFPYGAFHGAAVKAEVYRPDWRAEARVAYTTALGRIMAALLPEGGAASISTVPGGFAADVRGAEREIAEGLLRAAAALERIAQATGRSITLAIEPEPCCLLETLPDAIAFFEAQVFSAAGVARFAEAAGLARPAAEAALRARLGLCYDVCHQAVEFEAPRAGLAALRGAGIAVHKAQLSAALRILSVDGAAREALASFAEPVYLHQVVAQDAAGRLSRYADLPEALARGAASDGEEWRIHYHVPIFAAEAGPFATTQAVLEDVLALHREQPIAPVLEVETYTWDVLPPPLRAESKEAAIARELAWVRARLP